MNYLCNYVPRSPTGSDAQIGIHLRLSHLTHIMPSNLLLLARIASSAKFQQRCPLLRRLGLLHPQKRTFDRLPATSEFDPLRKSRYGVAAAIRSGTSSLSVARRRTIFGHLFRPAGRLTDIDGIGLPHGVGSMGWPARSIRKPGMAPTSWQRQFPYVFVRSSRRLQRNGPC
jgi:hypothetical protein